MVRISRWQKLLSLVSANVVPVVGVVVFDWSLVIVTLLYWVEIGVVIGLASFCALFAREPFQRSMEAAPIIGAIRSKRGYVSVPFTELRANVSCIIDTALFTPVALGLWFVGGVLGLVSLKVAVGIGIEENTFADQIEREGALLLAGTIGVVFSRGYDAYKSYFRSGAYRTETMRDVLWWPRIVALLIIGVSVAGFVLWAAGAPATVALFFLVAGKFGIDYGTVYTDRLERDIRRITNHIKTQYLGADIESSVQRCRTPSTNELAVTTVVKPRLSAVVLGGAAHTLSSLIAVGGIGIIGVVVLLFTTTQILVPLITVGIVTIALIGALDSVIRYGFMEYRIGEQVVGYDRLVNEPQWTVSRSTLQTATQTQSWSDRLFETTTVTVRTDHHTIRLPFVSTSTPLTSERGRG